MCYCNPSIRTPSCGPMCKAKVDRMAVVGGDNKNSGWTAQVNNGVLHSTYQSDGTIKLNSGTYFNPMRPDPLLICVEDVACGLSKCCRYGGQLEPFFSVGQHAILVSFFVHEEAKRQGYWPREAAYIAYQGLHHDDSEGLGLPDLPKPLKVQPEFAAYREIERRLQRCAYTAFGCEPEDHPLVKEFDVRCLWTEQRDLRGGDFDTEPHFLPVRIAPCSHQQARQAFIRRHRELGARITGTHPLPCEVTPEDVNCQRRPQGTPGPLREA